MTIQDLPNTFKSKLSEWADKEDVVYIWSDSYNAESSFKTFYVVVDNGRETECLRIFGVNKPDVSVDKRQLHKELRGA